MSDIRARLHDFITNGIRLTTEQYQDLATDAYNEIVATWAAADECKSELRLACARIDNVRVDALEEAARYCESLRLAAFGEPSDEFRYNNQLCENFARGIRALKDNRDE